MESANSKINKFKMRHVLRSRYAPSLGSGSTAKTFPRKVFSAQDDSEGRAAQTLYPSHAEIPLRARLWASSTSKTFPRNVFSAQDDSVGRAA